MLENYIDLIIVFYLGMYFISGLRKSLPNAISDFISIAVAIILSLSTFRLTSSLLTKYFPISAAYANPLGFFLNAFVFKILLLFLLDGVFRKTENPFGIKDTFFKRFISGALSLLYGLFSVIIAFAVIFSLSLPAIITKEIDQSRFGSAARRDPLKINRSFEEIFGQLYGAAERDFGFMKIETGPTEKVDLGLKTIETSVDSEAEEKMLEMVNKERTSRGLKALTMDEEARRAARDYGKYLFKNGIFSHVDLEGKGPSDRMKNYKVEYLILGENLAYAPSLEEAHNGLMRSKGHRENILHPLFNRVGIGVIHAEDYGNIYVQEFLN